MSVYQEPLLPRLLRWLRQHRKATLYSILGLSFGSLFIVAGSLLWQLWRTDIDSRREAALSRFLSLATGRAQLIDASFLEYQGQLEALTAASRQLLLQGHGRPVSTFLTLSSKPAGLAPAPVYARDISLTHPSLETAPGVKASALQAQLQRLKPVLEQFRPLFQIQSAESEQRLRNFGQSLSWASLELESGASLRFPGIASQTPAAADFRQAALYQQAAAQHAPLWGRPYKDNSQLGLLLPVLAPMRSPEGRLLGVVGLELALNHLLPKLLKLPEQPGIRRIALLDPEGRPLVTIGNHVKDDVLSTGASEPLVAAAELSRQANGVVKQPDGKLRAYFRLGSLGWYYLIELKEPA